MLAAPLPLYDELPPLDDPPLYDERLLSRAGRSDDVVDDDVVNDDERESVRPDEDDELLRPLLLPPDRPLPLPLLER